MHKSSELLKISQNSFKIIKISKDYTSSTGTGTSFAINAVLAAGVLPAIGAGFGNVVGLGVGNTSNIEEVKMVFEFFKDN